MQKTLLSIVVLCTLAIATDSLPAAHMKKAISTLKNNGYEITPIKGDIGCLNDNYCGVFAKNMLSIESMGGVLQVTKNFTVSPEKYLSVCSMLVRSMTGASKKESLQAVADALVLSKKAETRGVYFHDTEITFSSTGKKCKVYRKY